MVSSPFYTLIPSNLLEVQKSTKDVFVLRFAIDWTSNFWKTSLKEQTVNVCFASGMFLLLDAALLTSITYFFMDWETSMNDLLRSSPNASAQQTFLTTGAMQVEEEKAILVQVFTKSSMTLARYQFLPQLSNLQILDLMFLVSAVKYFSLKQSFLVEMHLPSFTNFHTDETPSRPSYSGSFLLLVAEWMINCLPSFETSKRLSMRPFICFISFAGSHWFELIMPQTLMSWVLERMAYSSASMLNIFWCFSFISLQYQFFILSLSLLTQSRNSDNAAFFNYLCFLRFSASKFLNLALMSSTSDLLVNFYSIGRVTTLTFWPLIVEWQRRILPSYSSCDFSSTLKQVTFKRLSFSAALISQELKMMYLSESSGSSSQTPFTSICWERMPAAIECRLERNIFLSSSYTSQMIMVLSTASISLMSLQNALIRNSSLFSSAVISIVFASQPSISQYLILKQYLLISYKNCNTWERGYKKQMLLPAEY